MMKDIKMISALSIILGFVGIILMFIGIFYQNYFPWITFRIQPYPQPPVTKPWQWVFYEISPFVLKTQVQGEIAQLRWYYKIDSTISGFFCLFGVAVYLINILKRNKWIGIISCFISLSSLLVFGSTLPGYFPSTKWGSGAMLIIYGSFCLIASEIFDYIAKDLQKERILYNKLLKLWNSNNNLLS